MLPRLAAVRAGPLWQLNRLPAPLLSSSISPAAAAQMGAARAAPCLSVPFSPPMRAASLACLASGKKNGSGGSGSSSSSSRWRGLVFGEFRTSQVLLTSMLAMSAIALGVAFDAEDEKEQAEEKEEAADPSYGCLPFTCSFTAALMVTRAWTSLTSVGQCSSHALCFRAMEATAIVCTVDHLSDNRSQLAGLPRLCAAGTRLACCAVALLSICRSLWHPAPSTSA
jgi:hypothetical protein